MNIFTVRDSKAIPSEHALITTPFSEIWLRDESPNKGRAIKEFTYIELMCSLKKSNVFNGFPEQIRHEKVVKNIYGEGYEFRPDTLIAKALSTYKELQLEASASLRLVEAAKGAMQKVEEFLNNVDFKDRTKGGAAVYKPVDITNAIAKLAQARIDIKNFEEQAQQELSDTSKTRGNRAINLFEDPT